jgi:hypothetical protein
MRKREIVNKRLKVVQKEENAEVKKCRKRKKVCGTKF